MIEAEVAPQPEVGVDITEDGKSIPPNRCQHLTDLRRHYMRYIKSLDNYLGVIGENGMQGKLRDKSGSMKPFVIAEADRLIGILGYPVKTKSASQKAWKHVFGN